MRKKVKRVVASTMAALMMLSLAPVSAFNGTLVNNVIAADLTYEGLNLSGGVKAGTSYFNSLGLQPLSDVNYSEKSYTIEGVSYPGYLDIGGTDADGVKKKIPTKNAYKLTPTKTGDFSRNMIAVYAILMLMALLAGSVVLFEKKRKRA